MQNNLSRYESDIKKLVGEGRLLLFAMQYEQHPEEFSKLYKKEFGSKYENFLKNIPTFREKYQDWYSESKSLVKQIIPDRLSDFVKHYERQINRKSIQWDNYTIEDYLQNLASRGGDVPMAAGISRMEQQLNIVKSAEQRFKSSLFDIRQVVAADLFDSEIEAARELLKQKFLRAAGAIAGVILEKHLAQVCENHTIKVNKKNPTINDFNELLKEANVIDTPPWRLNQHLADIRNVCSHNKAVEPTEEQVRDLIDGVAKVLKTLF
jgi:hypothetical protein